MGLGRGVFSFILRNNQRSMLPLMFDTFGELCFRCVTGEERVGPPLNKKLFPLYWPGGSKRADWNFFSSYLKKKKKNLVPPLYILVYKKMKLEEKKNSHLPTGFFFAHPVHRKRFFT